MEKESIIKTVISDKFSTKNVKKSLKRAIIIFVFVVIAFCLGFYIGLTEPWERLGPSTFIVDDPDADDQIILTIDTIEKIFQPASDLVTSRYIYKDADTYENFKEIFGKKLPFTTDMTVFTYEGSVSVGIDLLDIKYEIDNENQVISIFIPDLKVMANEIDEDSFKYPFKSDSIFNSTDMSDFTTLISTLEKEKEEVVLNDREFMDSARENAENVLKGFLTASDATKDFTVKFK